MGWCVRVDPVSSPMDGDVVVVPAEGGEVGGGVVASLMSWNHMVGLEAVAVTAGVDDTFAVSGEYGPSEPFGYPAPGRFDIHCLAVCDGDGFDPSFAFGFFNSLGSCSGPSEHFHSLGVIGLVGK